MAACDRTTVLSVCNRGAAFRGCVGERLEDTRWKLRPKIMAGELWNPPLMLVQEARPKSTLIGDFLFVSPQNATFIIS